MLQCKQTDRRAARDGLKRSGASGGTPASGRSVQRVPGAAGRDAVPHRVSLQRSERRERPVDLPRGSVSGAEPRLRAAVVQESSGGGHVRSGAASQSVCVTCL